MNKQFLLASFLFCGLLQQNNVKAADGYVPSPDRQECEILRNNILALLFKERNGDYPQTCYHSRGYINNRPDDSQHYVNSMIKMYEGLRCDRFKDNFNSATK
jgi:hypothetical protein